MTTYATMVTRILSELKRPSLTADTQDAIQQAILEHQTERFFFNEHCAVTTTSSSLETYALPADFLELDRLTAEVSSDEYPLHERTWQWMGDRRRNSSTFLGYPTDFGIYREQIYLYPTPNGAYPLNIYYLRDLGTLTGTADTNAWMTDGERLIRTTAKRILAEDVLDSDRLAQRFAVRERATLSQLLGQSTQRIATGRIRGWYF